MKKIRLVINGFGRIGRAAFRIANKRRDVVVVAINDLTDTGSLAHLLKYDSVYGRYEPPVSSDKSNLIVSGRKIPVTAEKDPAKLPWAKLQVDVVLECTGRFVENDSAMAQIKTGA